MMNIIVSSVPFCSILVAASSSSVLKVVSPLSYEVLEAYPSPPVAWVVGRARRRERTPRKEAGRRNVSLMGMREAVDAGRMWTGRGTRSGDEAEAARGDKESRLRTAIRQIRVLTPPWLRAGVLSAPGGLPLQARLRGRLGLRRRASHDAASVGSLVVAPQRCPCDREHRFTEVLVFLCPDFSCLLSLSFLSIRSFSGLSLTWKDGA